MTQSKINFVHNVKTVFAVHSKKIMGAVGVVLFILSLAFVYKSYIQPMLEKKYANNNEFLQKKEKQLVKEEKSAKLLLFWADWCPNSIEGKPAWDEFVSTYAGKKINGVVIHTKDYECDKNGNDNSNLLKEYDVEGVPTVVLIKDDHIVTKSENDYVKMNAKLTVFNLLEFVKVSV